MFNALSLAIIITLAIGLYFYSFLHKSSTQTSIRTLVTTPQSTSSSYGDVKENPFILLFDTILWVKLRLIYYVNN